MSAANRCGYPSLQPKKQKGVHMASRITQLKTIRIKNETAEYFRDKPLNRLVDSMCEKMKEHTLEIEGEEICVIYKYNIRRMEKACRGIGVDPELLFRNLIKQLEEEKAKKKAEKA